ncbi:hypothetical protein K2173_008859 [Erythroxylum novogranatense]|uniref:Uncharacterized protein n=1 Tax=Erythroxylum novogranatense TaxID=1862640 RepID=A0AAV8S4Y5_9ROSI|nr:hypothetical protein K2173_008859 [Erythroxylum novogranatense]
MTTPKRILAKWAHINSIITPSVIVLCNRVVLELLGGSYEIFSFSGFQYRGKAVKLYFLKSETNFCFQFSPEVRSMRMAE